MLPDLAKSAAIASSMTGKEIPNWIQAGVKLGIHCTLSSIITQADHFGMDCCTYLGLVRYDYDNIPVCVEKPDDDERTRELRQD